MVNPVSGVSRALTSYDQQRFYAERATKLKLPKTYQLGAQDKVTFSQDAAAKQTATIKAPQFQGPVAEFTPAQTAVQYVSIFRGPMAQGSTEQVQAAKVKQITYDDPRKEARKRQNRLAEVIKAFEPLASRLSERAEETEDFVDLAAEIANRDASDKEPPQRRPAQAPVEEEGVHATAF